MSFVNLSSEMFYKRRRTQYAVPGGESNTEKSLDRIYKFLGLSYEKFNNRTEMDNHILGHNMRKSFSGKIIERTEWRSEISKEKQKEITLIMKPYLKKFDYI